MRTVVLFEKGDLRIQEHPIPVVNPMQVLVRFAYGGICGSDMHYYFHGVNGAFAVRHPFILGHEVSGTVVEVGNQVTTIKPGDAVAINPGVSCRECHYCRVGRENLCTHVRFYGSAATDPHTDGAFSEFLAVDARQCMVLPPTMDLAAAAAAEPLAVALHAVNRAGPLLGKSVLITGAGTVGILILLVARALGCKSTTVTDTIDERLERARACGAGRIINITREGYPTDEPVDIVFETSGDVAALNSAIAQVARGGTIVQLGFLPPGELGITGIALTTKELNLIGTFRFGIEFDWALAYLVSGKIDVRPLITHAYPVDQAREAFAMAADGRQSVKVQLFFPN